MGGKHFPTLGCASRLCFVSFDRAGQMSRHTTGGNRRDPPPPCGKMYPRREWGGSKRGLWSTPTLLWPEGRNR
eukprot:3383062-Ditylum_brightwellii.AAC.1